MNFLTLPSEAPAGKVQLSLAHLAPDHPKAVVVLVHGMAEHKERYFPVMTYLAEMGFASVIFDLRGHGASVATKDDLGHFGKKGVDSLLSDTQRVVEWAHTRFPGLKLFLFGHSMGSLIVRCYTRQHDDTLDGLVVCGSPSANPATGAGIFLTYVVQLFKGAHYRSTTIAKLVFGGYEKPLAKEAPQGVHNKWLSTNMANVEAYNNDPLCGFKFTVNGYRTLFQLMQTTYSDKGWKVTKPALPVHFMAGGQDPCIGSVDKFSKAVDSLRRAGYANITTKLYPGLRHEILNEIGREDVWRDLAALLGGW